MTSLLPSFSPLPFPPHNGNLLPIEKKAIHYYLAFYNNNSSHKLEMEKGGLWVEEIECGNGAEGGQGRDKTGNTRGDLSKLRYGLVTGLAAVGLAETSYLTWVKLFGGAVSCPTGGATCSDVLNSDYAMVFGVPLPFIGLLAYGTVTVLGVWTLLNTGNQAREEDGVVGWLLLASTTAMAVASAYFMYILNVKLEGASCTYCVGSALLSLSLLLCTLKGFTTKDIRNVVSLQLLVGASVVVGLTVAFGDANSAFARGDIDLPPLEPEVSTSSSPKELSLAKHLRSIGAKMYGAFWCSHCFEQKQMFGKEAMKYVEYVECFPEGYRKGVQIAKACEAANIQGFPTWIINGQQFSGEQELSQLAEASGFDASKVAN
ncbi:unnamed protein product [Sphagnum jensenii]|uniref:Vitamin K epoxide reductase domain-containing protein n=1 Tax=Sphagnum jensenii TaxID=128206 RepID=A0ABP0X186_9BRYO